MKNKETKKENLHFPLKLVPVLYGLMFILVLFLLLFLSNNEYHLKRDFLISNIFVLIPFLICIFLFNKFHKDPDINANKFKKYIIIISSITLILQIILLTHTFFYTDWDVKVIRGLVNKFVSEGRIKEDFYLSVYPNNILLTAILSFIKCIPFIGKYYMTTLIINALIVNISGILTACAIKNIKNNKIALLSYVVMIPLVLLSPWINIPYSDTFALPFAATIIYLYSKNSKNKKDCFLIGLFSILGYKIKPTIIILTISIIIVEFFSNSIKPYLKRKILNILLFICGTVAGFLFFNLSKLYLNFEPVSYAKPITFVHYLAMGQNDETLGAYSQKDVDDTIIYGEKNDIKKFKERIKNRTLKQTLSFYHKKTLLNFNDGSFCWGLDGTFFYKKVKSPNSFANFLREIYYSDGKHFKLFIQVMNYMWLIVLLLCPWMIRKKNNKSEIMIMLSIIGLVLFLTIFEPRTRYMYCFSSTFIISAILGLSNLNNYIETLKMKKGNQRLKEVNNEK